LNIFDSQSLVSFDWLPEAVNAMLKILFLLRCQRLVLYWSQNFGILMQPYPPVHVVKPRVCNSLAFWCSLATRN